MFHLFARLLSIVAIIGFIVGPTLTPPAWAVNAASLSSHADNMNGKGLMAGTGFAKGGMERCSRHKPAMPACPKNCPWATLCIAKYLPNTASAASFVLIKLTLTDPITSDNDRRRGRLGEPPPPRPPKT